MANKGPTILTTTHFSSNTMEAKKQWNKNFKKCLKENNCQYRILYSIKIYIRNEGII